MNNWISVKDRLPDRKEPIIYIKRKEFKKGWFVGIAYWTVSDKWHPQYESIGNPKGFTHWQPLPEPPKDN